MDREYKALSRSDRRLCQICVLGDFNIDFNKKQVVRREMGGFVDFFSLCDAVGVVNDNRMDISTYYSKGDWRHRGSRIYAILINEGFLQFLHNNLGNE